MKMIKLCAVAAITLIGCGDNKGTPDAHVKNDAAPDSMVPFPAAPTIGDQIDRLGRPAVNTVLNHGFDGTPGADTAKGAYNEQSAKSDWLTNIPEFMGNLGIIDVLDTFCGNGVCDQGEANVAIPATAAACPLDCPTAAQVGSGNGCGNQALYNGIPGGGPPAEDSYSTLAFVLSNDEVFLDSSKSVCDGYLAIEARILVPSLSTCGGRAPEYDVIDSSYSMLAAGFGGFNPATFEPKIKDGAPPHTDYLDAFPYLGPPHP